MFTLQVQNPAIPLPRFGPPIYLKNKKEKEKGEHGLLKPIEEAID